MITVYKLVPLPEVYLHLIITSSFYATTLKFLLANLDFELMSSGEGMPSNEPVESCPRR